MENNKYTRVYIYMYVCIPIYIWVSIPTHIHMSIKKSIHQPTKPIKNKHINTGNRIAVTRQERLVEEGRMSKSSVWWLTKTKLLVVSMLSCIQKSKHVKCFVMFITYVMLQTATLINKIRRKFKKRVISREHWTQCSRYRESGKKKKKPTTLLSLLFHSL